MSEAFKRIDLEHPVRKGTDVIEIVHYCQIDYLKVIQKKSLEIQFPYFNRFERLLPKIDHRNHKWNLKLDILHRLSFYPSLKFEILKSFPADKRFFKSLTEVWSIEFLMQNSIEVHTQENPISQIELKIH